jgi:hypothetical protein
MRHFLFFVNHTSVRMFAGIVRGKSPMNEQIDRPHFSLVPECHIEVSHFRLQRRVGYASSLRQLANSLRPPPTSSHNSFEWEQVVYFLFVAFGRGRECGIRPWFCLFFNVQEVPRCQHRLLSNCTRRQALRDWRRMASASSFGRLVAR